MEAITPGFDRIGHFWGDFDPTKSYVERSLGRAEKDSAIFSQKCPKMTKNRLFHPFIIDVLAPKSD
jgi:hypothetical protein